MSPLLPARQRRIRASYVPVTSFRSVRRIRALSNCGRPRRCNTAVVCAVPCLGVELGSPSHLDYSVRHPSLSAA